VRVYPAPKKNETSAMAAAYVVDAHMHLVKLQDAMDELKFKMRRGELDVHDCYDVRKHANKLIRAVKGIERSLKYYEEEGKETE
jgi:hypothetical protein